MARARCSRRSMGEVGPSSRRARERGARTAQRGRESSSGSAASLPAGIVATGRWGRHRARGGRRDPLATSSTRTEPVAESGPPTANEIQSVVRIAPSPAMARRRRASARAGRARPVARAAYAPNAASRPHQKRGPGRSTRPLTSPHKRGCLVHAWMVATDRPLRVGRVITVRHASEGPRLCRIPPG